MIEITFDKDHIRFSDSVYIQKMDRNLRIVVELVNESGDSLITDFLSTPQWKATLPTSYGVFCSQNLVQFLYDNHTKIDLLHTFYQIMSTDNKQSLILNCKFIGLHSSVIGVLQQALPAKNTEGIVYFEKLCPNFAVVFTHD